MRGTAALDPIQLEADMARTAVPMTQMPSFKRDAVLETEGEG